jgi:hypothetical protein
MLEVQDDKSNWTTRQISDTFDNHKPGVEVFVHRGIHEEAFSERRLAVIHLVVIFDVPA